MDLTRDDPEKPTRYGIGLAQVARAHLVGREDELGALWAGLERACHGPQIMAITGPAGIGKTAATSVFRLEAGRAGHRTFWFGGEQNNANRMQFEARLRQTGIPLDQLGRAAVPDVLVVDALEQISGVAAWLLTEGLLRAGPRLLTVFTSRTRLPLSLRAHIAVAPILHEISMGPLSDSNSALLLNRFGLPLEHQQAMMSLCKGFPLALILAAETKLEHGSPDRSTTEVIREFAEAIIVNSEPERREALFALSVVRELDRQLLHAMIPDAVPALFDSLCELPFLHHRATGLSPHALVREVFFDYLLKHQRAVHARLAERAIRALLAKVTAADQTDYRRRVFDAAYTCRHDPQVQYLGAQEVSETLVVPMPDHRVAEVADAIARVEGEVSRRSFLALHIGGHLETFIVCDANTEALRGVLSSVELNEVPEKHVMADPLLAAAAPRARALPRASEGVRIDRWFFQPERYQSQEGAALIMFAGPPISLNRSYQPAWDVFINSPAEAWEALTPIYRMKQLGEAVSFHGRRYGVFAKDLASDLPPNALLRALSIDSILIMTGLASVEDRRATVGITLDELKDALGCVRGPGLARTTLARRFVNLAKTFDEALAAMQSQGNTEHAMILKASYWARPVKQRATAADLGLTYGTYRRRLRQAQESFRVQLENMERSHR